MLYALLRYDHEDIVESCTPEQDAAVVARLDAVTDELARAGRLGPVARLMPTTTATTLRRGKGILVLDGPFAETREQLLGFFIVECASLEEAIATARDLGQAGGTNGTYEIRPLHLPRPQAPRP